MKANQPWSGYYEVGPAIWAAGTALLFIVVASVLVAYLSLHSPRTLCYFFSSICLLFGGR